MDIRCLIFHFDIYILNFHMSNDLVEKLKKEIESFQGKEGVQKIGTVVEVGDGIAKLSGLSEALSQELLTIEAKEGDVPALAFNLEDTFVGIVVLGDPLMIKVGDRVRKTGRVLSLQVGDELIGRVVNALGEPVDDKGVIFKNPEKAKAYVLERSAPSVLARESVNTPVQTGIKAIDAMIPIGRGQRELIIGDRQTGKTAIVLDTILNQGQDPSRRQVICIYVAVGQKNSKVARIVKILEERGALKYTVVVSASSSAPPAAPQ